MFTIQRICVVCNTPFEIKHPNQKICTEECRIINKKRKAKVRAQKYRKEHKYDYRDYMMDYMWQWRRKYPQSQKKSIGSKYTNQSPNMAKDKDNNPDFDTELKDVRHMCLRSMGKSLIPKALLTANIDNK